ncbi:MAG: hypothetical protein LUF85_11165 [Bacteroides sp.]|nr:hypothetical protein [Bacteroides sp.]
MDPLTRKTSFCRNPTLARAEDTRLTNAEKSGHAPISGYRCISAKMGPNPENRPFAPGKPSDCTWQTNGLNLTIEAFAPGK